MLTIKWALVIFMFFINAAAEADPVAQSKTGISSSYFENVMCASESSSFAKIFNKQGQEYSNQTVEFIRLSEKYTKLAIESGIKAGKSKEHTKQLIEYQASNSYKFNEKYIEKNGFEEFHKNGFGMFNLKCKK
ncbi:hypothetical protein GCM10011613_35960 [Cellvibrio zantedeschiae]|uniref:Uncharacterized protein n=1 Tax=Cellvibrio zantedeschiae TaxID=1237077 RepID=A0ABQ3BAC8_9GAMM|nr:hypothetical protein [Cellvibrio zantedeschiae]GGY87758.1 hypothetical protein GCM10011613_35960 [Cellvibrio zantedeschiae]